MNSNNNNNDKNNIINFNNVNINNDNKQTNINTKNNYINNNININVINNGDLDSALKKSFFNKNIINNNYNININSLRMSYQKKDNKLSIKTKQKYRNKKSNSLKVKSLKEKYRNSANVYLNSYLKNKISLEDDEEEDESSEKESENSDSNLSSISPQVATKKNNTKIIPDLTAIKDDLFAKTIIAFLLDENIDIKNSNKNNNSISKYKVNKIISNHNEEPKNMEANKNKKKVKRSSLCPGIKFQFKNKNKHVTFNQKNSAKMEENYEINENKDAIPKKKYKINDDIDNNNNKLNNNLKRIKLYENND